MSAVVGDAVAATAAHVGAGMGRARMVSWRTVISFTMSLVRLKLYDLSAFRSSSSFVRFSTFAESACIVVSWPLLCCACALNLDWRMSMFLDSFSNMRVKPAEPGESAKGMPFAGRDGVLVLGRGHLEGLRDRSGVVGVKMGASSGGTCGFLLEEEEGVLEGVDPEPRVFCGSLFVDILPLGGIVGVGEDVEAEEFKTFASV